MAAIQIGDILDAKYRIVKLLGRGGFGEVYLAKDELVGRHVALKVLWDRDPAREAGLIHEMRSLDQLHHPKVVTFYHHFEQDRLMFLVMEYCAGGSLRDQMLWRPAPLQSVMQWGKELADTLNFVHQHGIVHHDIKPDNLLVTSEDILKIGDFGIANRNGGTPAYVAPEMLLGGVDSGDIRLDVYALGITLLELLRNCNPFDGMSSAEMQRSKMRHDFISPDLEQWAQELISKATHPTPELRFQTMQDFREAIDSKHVSYVFARGRIQAHALAERAEKLLARKQTTAASKYITQALYACADCVSALVAEGRYNLFVNRIAEAKASFDHALALNPRTQIQKELGWLCLETGNYAQAISLLTDHLQRNAADYEAFNLLLECFYRTRRYEPGMQLARLMVDENAPSDCFENNGLLCGMLVNSTDEELVKQALKKLASPFIEYNVDVMMQAPDQLLPLLLFENYRFGLRSRKENTLTIEHRGNPQKEYKNPLITIGRLDSNRVCLADNNVSRRHCLIVNFSDDVWVYDVGSTHGVFVDGEKINRKAYLQGVHVLKLGDTELTVCSRLGLLV